MDLKELKENFDIKEYFDDRGIFYSEGGEENVTVGWINISCIFCYDHKNHLGINLKTKHFSCWLCKETGDILKLIMEIDKTPFSKAIQTLKSFQDSPTEEIQIIESSKKERKNRVLPTGCIDIVMGSEPLIVKKFFQKRNFHLDLIHTYNLKYCEYGEYNLRLIAPIELEGHIVSYQAVDLTGRSKLKYLDCPPRKGVLENKHLLYGIGDINNEQVILVEGITDKWRIGKYGLAFFGKNYTKEQYVLMLTYIKRDTKIKVLFDPDASEDGIKFAKLLSANYKNVLFIDLEGERDPAELNEEEVNSIIDL